MATPTRRRASIEVTLFFRPSSTFDILVQESTSSNENRSASPLPLMNFPAEIRKEIYKQLFHEWHDDDLSCNIFLKGRGNVGCWCGNGLSLANHQLYNETRHIFYKCIIFSFMDPMSCKRFFRNFGQKIEWVTSLKIAYTNIDSQVYLLQDIFRYFPTNSNLRSLEFQVSSDDDYLEPDSDSRPQYLPSSSKKFEAVRYDLFWRPLTHPLNVLKSITSLTVLGYPTFDMEEALFKLTMEMEERATKERKRIKKVGKLVERTTLGESEWFYKIEIMDEDVGSWSDSKVEFDP